MEESEGKCEWKRGEMSEKGRKTEEDGRRKRKNVRDLGRLRNRDDQGEIGRKWGSKEE